MNEKYERILNVNKKPSPRHKPMAPSDRAAQFAPYAALTGFEAVVSEEARLTERRIELDDYEIERLNEKLKVILDNGCRASVTYFVSDKRKSGGAYLTKCGVAVRVDEFERCLIMSEGTEIPIDDIIEISF